MNVIIVGAGRMGIRHAQGVAQIKEVNKIKIVDINQSALDNACAILEHNTPKYEFSLVDALYTEGGHFDIVIMASTANNRGELVNLLALLGCKYMLVEKPLGQSYQEVIEFNNIVAQSGIDCFVNLNMRLYDGFIKLRDDFKEIPQLLGVKTITMNTGTLGIGANGIHYLDLLYFLFDADNAKISAAEIDNTTIRSGRGEHFCDFGGWSVINFYKNDQVVGKSMLSMSATSTVFGSWDIVASHGRIIIDEAFQKRTDIFRKADSTMPVNRYFADYLPPVESQMESPFLGDLTAKWLKALLKREHLLPTVEQSIKVHALMFEWLNHSKTHQNHFPIT
jgi:predicted dehydrogenase